RLGNYAERGADTGVSRSRRSRQQFRQRKRPIQISSQRRGKFRVPRSDRQQCDTDDAIYLPELPQSVGLAASSAGGYTSVPLGCARAPAVNFAGSILSCPTMCLTGLLASADHWLPTIRS